MGFDRKLLLAVLAAAIGFVITIFLVHHNILIGWVAVSIAVAWMALATNE